MLRTVLLLGLAALLPEVSAVDVTPLQKVVELLSGALAKCKADKHDETVEHSAFSQWCESTQAETKKSINVGAAQIEQLEADIAKAESDAETLGEEVSELEASVAKMTDEMKSATAVYDAEFKDYTAEHADYTESIDACERAAQVLRARSQDVPQTLMQVQKLKKVPADAMATIQSFLSTHSANGDGPPQPNAYEFQSSDVIKMLEKLRLQFQDQRLVLEKEELNRKGNFEVFKQSLTDHIKADEPAIDKKTSMKASRKEDAATGKIDLETVQETKASDEKKLEDVVSDCQARTNEYNTNQATRADEIEAVQKAIEILDSSAVKGNAEKYLPASALVQATSFAQLLRGGSPEDDLMRRQLVEFLQGRAEKLGSRYLAVLANRAAEDPFGKVKKMIKDLIVKLMEKANAEADQNAFCQTELATNKLTRENKASEVEMLTSEIDELTATSAELSSEIAELTDAISSIRAEQSESSRLREEESKTNAKTVADAKEAQAAVQKATQVLREYYNKAAGASLLQGAEALKEEMMQASSEPYKGMQDTSTGIFGMLEVVMSDFARLESETSASEDQAASAHQKFLDVSNETAAVKATEVEHKQGNKFQTDDRNRNLKKELELTTEELDVAQSYHAKLKAECVDTGLSFEARTQAREQELQSLMEALKILNQENLE